MFQTPIQERIERVVTNGSVFKDDGYWRGERKISRMNKNRPDSGLKLQKALCLMEQETAETEERRRDLHGEYMRLIAALSDESFNLALREAGTLYLNFPPANQNN
jgi:hypothetical protein